MSDPAVKAAQAIHDTCPSTDCYDLSTDAANCQACTEQGRVGVEAARPIIEAEQVAGYITATVAARCDFDCDHCQDGRAAVRTEPEK